MVLLVSWVLRVVLLYDFLCFFFSSRGRHTSCALVTGVQTCALPICEAPGRKCQHQEGASVYSAGVAKVQRPKSTGLGYREAVITAVAFQAHEEEEAHLSKGKRDHDERYAGGAQAYRAGHRRGNTAYRSEEHTSELQSLMRISYAVFCLKKKKKQQKVHDSGMTSKNHYTTQQSTTQAIK